MKISQLKIQKRVIGAHCTGRNSYDPTTRTRTALQKKKMRQRKRIRGQARSISSKGCCHGRNGDHHRGNKASNRGAGRTEVNLQVRRHSRRGVGSVEDASVGNSGQRAHLRITAIGGEVDCEGDILAITRGREHTKNDTRMNALF